MAAHPRVIPILAALAAASAAGLLPAAEPTPKPAIRTTSVKPTNPLEALQAQARAAKAPGGSPESESAALLSKLSRTHTRSLDSDNARVKARFAASSGLVMGTAGSGAIGGATGPGAASAESASAKGQKGIAPDPCGSTFELKAIAASPPLEPGEAVLLEGCGFGPSTTGGEVRLVGDFPGGFLKLQLDAWTSHKILVYVPQVTGVPDVPNAKIQVFRKDGKFTNWLDVGFRATRVVQRIHPTAVSVSCGIPQAQQECTLASSHPLSETSFFGGATFAAKHASNSTYPIDCDEPVNLLGGNKSEGTDVATISLKNGWLLAGYAWWWTEAGAGYVLTPAGFMQDTASSSVAMKWAAFSSYCGGPRNSVMRYRVDLYAVGPKGVPYK